MSDQNNKLPSLNADNFTNRELSTIDFNQRVLAQAQDTTVPLLERIKFVAIVGNNLDEFFMVRVASYVQKFKLGITTSRSDGATPAQLLAEIRRKVALLINEHRTTMYQLLEELEHHDIHIRSLDDLSPAHLEIVRKYFYDEVFPVLTPLAVDHARPFPFISNLSLNIGIYLRHDNAVDNNDLDFVRIKIPEALPRLVNLGKVISKYTGSEDVVDTFLWIEDVISANLDLLFPGMEVVETSPFRITRNADIDYEQEQDEELLDLSALIEAGVRERRFGSVVRLTVPDTISDNMLNRLIYELNVNRARDVYVVRGMLGAAGLFELMQLDHPELRYPPFVPKSLSIITQSEDIFSAIRQRDILVHHPYDSFAPVEEFFNAAARDPDVLAIKATLYRVGKNAPVVQALMAAREHDKQVAVLVELKARFDEENNLEWARALERQGVHVTYGVEKLQVKTHAKITLVIRRESGGLRRYVHLGTGNYNTATARQYSDLGVFTADPEIAEDATRLFNRLTGYAPNTTYNKLLVAPDHLRDGLSNLIDNEIRAAKEGKAARLVFKMNQLEEAFIIRKLYQASQAGVKIDLIVRGLCCLRPGIAGLSENIRVRSIIGRFLEHPRIYYFHNAPPDQRLYAGSADLMKRNLHRRVETVFPVLDSRLQRKIIRILATDLSCNDGAWEMLSDGTYKLSHSVSDGELCSSQEIFMRDSVGLDIDLP